MAKLSKKDIQSLACRIIEANPGGIRYTQLVQEIASKNPETPINTVHGSVWNLDAVFPGKITKPSRGLFKPSSSTADTLSGTMLPGPTEIPPASPNARPCCEADFYKPFAEWLKNDLDEVTEVAPLGGAALGAKWGTPDVVGVYKPRARDLIKFQLEIVSGEVKIDPQPVVAFGQAIAYRLFSAKTYIAMPSKITEEDLSRLEALCILFGVGLVLFDINVEAPNFTIRVRAQRFSPDMFYVNEFAERLKEHKSEIFERLFQ